MSEKIEIAQQRVVPLTSEAATRRRTGLIFAVVGATTFSGKGIIVKLGYQFGSDAVTLLMLRMLFALPLFILMALWVGRGKPSLKSSDWITLAGLGFLGFYLASALDFAGLKYITASLERLILCLQPTLVLLFGWMFFKRKILPRHVFGIAVSYAGVICVFGFEAARGENRSVGLGWLLVFLSTVSYATYLVWSGDFVKRLGSSRLVGIATSFACLFAIVQYFFLRPFESVYSIAPQVVWLSLLNATLCTIVPVLTVMLAIERVGPAVASQIGMLGPIFTILLGVLILHEPFTIATALGAVLVISGVIIFTRADSAIKR
ncbi:DMT family transporter [Verminephrobacter aporrectodeae]|uniref:DMT family transporter n=1 Tax=Verminephrobacter aporrectodeae TaxID=1110389 RepID=UPI00223898F9|nr:DMT family transporter [Verminephrobacter aporrectodeae]MCW5257524.1 DMT family transporter [Verminephrobacter aporrectodeae subsp. tuberculatae]MCW8177662.1 DMT family transporter [Verminephrobacter aporrectodeae subsp. tuberculatae]MCW8204904.1 DMT family transporter [Verminephrobacter aporrectodeae subsp. tuberculatae]MCW8207778.1 DMT family transporter [Verminephrobacter aporrectodeae subsp. tuberculatae]